MINYEVWLYPRFAMSLGPEPHDSSAQKKSVPYSPLTPLLTHSAKTRSAPDPGFIQRERLRSSVPGRTREQHKAFDALR
jgi:hypothetical protein